MADLADYLCARLVPVVVLSDAGRAEGLAEALVAGGLRVAEVTFRTPAASEAIRRMAEHPELVVGAGTVVRGEQVDRAADAGARFVVSPGLSATVVARARERGVDVLPGVVTPTEVIAALDLGIDTMKFFPAAQYGGVATLKALAAPFPGVRFVPTGGISPVDLPDYLSLPTVPAVGGSWMVRPDLVEAGDFPTVTELTAQAVRAAAAVPRGEQR
ncbi:bifunctional 4-hydroxy-2-oxoglutarate aldolase/2-dehydro-3-deoxy-phosphogluconate aldolase [Geodermatophilus sp. YIM 151500]|uniref:bifunctional 4-hydroxy-2-oxoglutarate aldolase/2-dehydro-3-deoxy-phosphogluconate aldolase n=1 Tax=Geodermatophilus sp. YIM 151500 TaxID=2984531 RepID=UPI0021E4A153|nr:bifunctional 4-hydroxy-2-oxoglutarate aldolase/2-dehydro-3-deoxy-phosphogluconate aldolase [Geodermatophilus sp. YIM 151500]MCV2489164.1 bifunctional 4-hydroxy-2-oxoglutarate aldolase/2-dehydro-3-deoxy-phosphogluconate aldolase [Geodermatophilus sp. YIM 151500]